MSINQASLFILVTLSLSLMTCISSPLGLIPKICSKVPTSNLDFCKTELKKSTCRSNLRLMGQFITVRAINASTHAQIVSSGKNYSSFAWDDTCIQTIGEAIDDLNDCLTELNTTSAKGVDIDALQSNGAGAMTSLNTCNEEAGDEEPPELMEAIVYAIKFIDVLLAIVNTMKP